MRFNLQDKKIAITFKYDYDYPQPDNHTCKVPRYTTCSIMSVNEDNSLGDVLAIGMSAASKHDAVRKATGRKIALAKALKTAGIDRTERKPLWEQFFQQVGF